MFTLHPQLAADTVTVGHFSLSALLLHRDGNYPWCLLVPRRAQITEVHQLAEADQQQLWWEANRLSAVMAREFSADKMNLAALGNQVPQLHLHCIARYHSDPAWPQPVWGAVPARPYDERALQERVRALRRALPELAAP